MQEDRAYHILQMILATEEDELDCESVLAVIHEYVEVDHRGGDTARFDDGVPAHLDRCASCKELYLTLHELVALEMSGELPALDTLWQEVAAATAGEPAADAKPTTTGEARRNRRADDATATDAEPGLLAVWLERLQPAPLVRVAAAGLVVALVAATFGWWQARSAAHDAHIMLHAIGNQSAIRSVELPDGGWAKLWYAPDHSEAVLYLSDIERGERVQCWLKSDGDRRVRVGQLETVENQSEWWIVNGEEALEKYESLIVTSESDGTELARIPLGVNP